MTSTPQVHYLRPNDKVWTPPSIVCFDTETRADVQPDGTEVNRLRNWCVRLVDRRPTDSGKQCDQIDHGVTHDDLADHIEILLKGRGTLWMFAHNLGFDLASSRLLLVLIGRGWEVVDLSADSGTPWVRLRLGGKRLIICDSFSWLPKPLEHIGAAVGIAKPDLPADDDSPKAWRDRCAADVNILTVAMLQLMAWWDDKQLGRWTFTGPSCGWNAMRHTSTVGKIVIDLDPDKVALDREAIHGGIRAVWRHGPQRPGRYVEADIERAYVTAAINLPLPAKRLRIFPTLDVDDRLLASDTVLPVARCRIRTDKPYYPARIGGSQWLPVGEFWTTLTQPEILAARDRGHLIELGTVAFHKAGQSLAPWGRWCDLAASGLDATIPTVATIAAKHWSRAVIGKWSQRKFTRTELGPAPTQSWGYEPAWNATLGVKASLMDIGGKRFLTTADGDGDNAYPAIFAFIEGYTRAAVVALVEALGPGKLLQADTDGILVENLTPDEWVVARAAVHPFRLREKKTYTRVDVRGPQHVLMDGERKFSGVPKSAVGDGANRYTFTQWPSLAAQMSLGDPGGYVTVPGQVKMRPTYAPAWVLADGTTTPVQAYIDGSGTNQIVPWSDSDAADWDTPLGPDQNHVLARLI